MKASVYDFQKKDAKVINIKQKIRREEVRSTDGTSTISKQANIVCIQ